VDELSGILREQKGFGDFEIVLNVYSDDTFDQPLDHTDEQNAAFQDRVYFQVGLNTNDDRLSVFAENCSVAPTQQRDDPRRYYLTKHGCKLDDTLEFHPAPRNVQRMSYESFSFVGVDDPGTYLQCDVLVCDVNASDERCVNRQCLTDSNERNKRKRRDFQSSAASFSEVNSIHNSEVNSIFAQSDKIYVNPIHIRKSSNNSNSNKPIKYTTNIVGIVMAVLIIGCVLIATITSFSIIKKKKTCEQGLP